MSDSEKFRFAVWLGILPSAAILLKAAGGRIYWGIPLLLIVMGSQWRLLGLAFLDQYRRQRKARRFLKTANNMLTPELVEKLKGYGQR